jgi:tetratricopeptide (TPR) repeat protein
MLDAFLGGSAPLVYHVSNLVLHMAASLCVFWVLLTLGYKQLLSVLLSLFFALHPMFVLLAAWVVTRGDLLLTIFAILSFILFLKSFRANKPLLIVGHGVALFLALLSKETAVAMPALCLVYYYFELRKKPSRKLIYYYLITWVVAPGAWYYLRSGIHTGQLSSDNLGLGAFTKNLPMLPDLIGKFFVPAHLQLVPLFSLPDLAVGIIAMAVFAAFIFKMRERSNVRIYFGLLWFLMCIFPVLLFRNSNAEYLFDYFYHRMYLPSIGLIMVVAELIARTSWWKTAYLPRVAIAALPILIYCAIASSCEVKYYNDPVTFFSESIARTPKSALCHNNRGVYYVNVLKDQQQAVRDFSKAIEIFPDYLVSILNRGGTYAGLGKHHEAMGDLQAALKLAPNDADTLFRLANLRYLVNDFAGAVADYNRVLGMDRLYPRILSKKAGSEAMLGQTRQALLDATEAIRLDAQDEEAYNSRGLANRSLGNLDAALSDFDAAIKLKKDYSRPYNNRGTVHLAKGNSQAALDDFGKAIEFDPAFAEAYSNRGSVEHELGKNDLALKDLDAALRLDSGFADAYQNRGVVRNVLKLFPGALADFNEALKLKPNNGDAYLGRGISKLYIEDRAGACEDWKRAQAMGSKDAATMLAEYCK